MPYYEYRCPDCNHTVEKKMSIQAEHPEHIFERCNRDETRPNCLTYCQFDRILSKTSFALEGAGWAHDGYSSTHTK